MEQLINVVNCKQVLLESGEIITNRFSYCKNLSAHMQSLV